MTKIQVIKDKQGVEKQHFITVPSMIMKSKGWRTSDNIDFLINDIGQVVLVKR